MSIRITTALVCIFLFGLLGATANAVPFGTFDPRSLAMGGAAVASGTSANAAYYNPALLSMYKTRKEIGRNSRFIFPTVTARAAEAVVDNLDIKDENLEQDLVNAINAFNQNMNSQTAQSVLNAATDLNSRLDQLIDGPVHADANVGMILGIGHKHEGGSIIINRRGVSTGAIENFSSDLALLEDYVEAMQFIETNGAAGVAHPELFNPDGTLIDQTGNLASIGNGSGLDITEVGMAVSKEFRILGRDIAIGITPKILRVITYDFTADAATGQTDSVKDENEDWDMNLDIGFAHQINSQWRAGLIFKNVRSLSFTTSLGTEIKLDPQVRAGLAYDSPWGLYAVDMDVIENDPVGYGSPSQLLSLGGEWKPKRWFQLRAGISRNMKGVGNNSDPVFSAGVRWDFGGILDLTYAQGASEVAYGLQLGYQF
ncbi:conjugal transfer protein TraF [Kaarinaea lacus]